MIPAKRIQPLQKATAHGATYTHEPLEQAVEGGGRVVAEAGVHGRRLRDGARRGDQPVEALRGRQRRDRPGRRVAGRDAREPVEVAGDRGRVGAGPERLQATRPAGPVPEEVARPREQDDPRVSRSPRSTSGTTRSTAYWNGASAAGPPRSASSGEGPRRLEAAGEVVDVGRAGARTGRRPRPRRRASRPAPARRPSSSAPSSSAAASPRRPR